MAARIKLKVVEGLMLGHEFIFEEHDTFLFGRMPDCHANFSEDECVSRYHCILEVSPPDASIRDQGSLTGTYVNGKKYGGRARNEGPAVGASGDYPAVPLSHRDRIEIGKTVMEFTVEVPTCSNCGAVISKQIAEDGSVIPGSYFCAICDPKLAASFTYREQHGADPVVLSRDANAIPGRQPDMEPGLIIEGYEIGEKLGEGGCGVVYAAKRKHDSRRFAIKVMLPQVADEDGKRRFVREIEIMKSLRHPHIVPLREYCHAKGIFYFMMDYCHGGSVDDLLKRRGGKLKLRDAVPIAIQALEGLAYAHRAGCIHRDVKPRNILLFEDNGHRKAMISDFGLAKNFQKAGLSGLTMTGDRAGTAYFVPREQITDFKRATPASDVWSMAATLYYMLTGQFARNFTIDKNPYDVILNETVVPIAVRSPKLPSKVAEVIDRALSDDVKTRFQTADEFLNSLTKALCLALLERDRNGPPSWNYWAEKWRALVSS